MYTKYVVYSLYTVVDAYRTCLCSLSLSELSLGVEHD